MGHYLSRLSYQFLIGFSLLFVLAGSTLAASTDFVASEDFTLSSVVGDVTADLIIFSGSQAESLDYNDGILQVTNVLGNSFRFGSTNTTVRCLKLLNVNGNLVSETPNSNPGQSYLTVTSAQGVFRLYPSAGSCTGSGGDIVSSGGRTPAAREQVTLGSSSVDAPLLQKFARAFVSLFRKNSTSVDRVSTAPRTQTQDSSLSTTAVIPPTADTQASVDENALSDLSSDTGTGDNDALPPRSPLGEVFNILKEVVLRFLHLFDFKS